MNTASKLANVLLNAVRTCDYKNGVDCNFYSLSSKIGLKVQRNSNHHGFKTNVWAYIVQKHLSHMDLAPKVYGYCCVNKKFAYFTEKVKIFNDFRYPEAWPTDGAFMQNKRIIEEFEISFMSGKFGFYGEDMHYNNIGFRNNWDGSIHPLAIDVAYFAGMDHKSYYTNVDDSINMFNEDYEAISLNYRIACEQSSRICGFHQMCLPSRDFVYV